VHGALDRRSPIAPSLTTLAERLQGAGWATGAVVYDCGWLTPKHGFARGFDDYRVRRWRTGKLARSAVNWVTRHRDEPFFFFLHTFEVHSDPKVLPYEAPGVSCRTIAANAGIDDPCCRGDLCGDRLLGAMSRGEEEVGSQDPALYRSMYDDSVRYLDRELGALFEDLRASGLWDGLTMVVTSDHGEEFHEHRGFGHLTVHDENLRVPLIIKWPDARRAGQVHHRPTASIDLVPTLLDAAGLPSDDLPGLHLDQRQPDEPLFAGTAAVVYLGRHKAIFGGPRRSDRVFDLARDPGEQDNLVASDPGQTARLRELVRRRRQWEQDLKAKLVATEGEPVRLTVEERERLRQLGYVDR
jgi:arylsulfatase A-like enzyme